MNAANRSEELARSNEALEAFARDVAHEIRTPIGQIAMIAQLLLERGDRARERDLHAWLQVQLDATRQMEETVRGLLGLARLSLAPPHMHDIDLSALCEALRAELSPREPRRAPLAWRIQRGMHLRGCLEQVTVLMRNLLSNAAKYTRHAEQPWVSVSACRHEGVQCVTVQDNGAGFDPALAQRLFQPFARLHGEGQFEGTGLGLSIVKRIVERHGGWIRAEGRSGEGARFEFAFAPPAH